MYKLLLSLTIILTSMSSFSVTQSDIRVEVLSSTKIDLPWPLAKLIQTEIAIYMPVMKGNQCMVEVNAVIEKTLKRNRKLHYNHNLSDNICNKVSEDQMEFIFVTNERSN